MSNLYRFSMEMSKASILHPRHLLRCTALMVLMMAWMMPARAQHPFTLTTESDITNSTQHYYLIQSIDRPTFYAIPHSTNENSKVSTTSIPNANMRWYFMDAGSDSDHQYYYIVNSTGRCLYRYDNNNDGIRIKNTYAELSSLSNEELNNYKYFLTQTGSDYFIHSKGAPDLYLNKKQTNVPYDPYIKTSTYTDAPSVWNFVAVGNVTWPQPFTISTIAEKHYYKFQNVTNSSFYLSKSEDWATVSRTGSNEDVWYFMDAGTDATYSNCHYCYIVNASTGKYLYYTGGTSNDVAKVMDYNSAENDKYCFLIVDAAYKPDNTNYATSYTIVPKLRQAYFSDKDSFAPMEMTDNSHLLLKNDRSSNNYNSHWRIEETVFDLVEAPTITNNYDGTISLSTTTTGATIYYTTNGDTPDNTSTAYSSPFLLGDATVIKAIAYLDSDCSNVSTYNVPRYTKPTISYDNSTSLVTITSEGTVYYTTNGDTPTISSTEYSGPFAVEPATTVKAIATHLGYLNSEVATKYIQSGDYSQDYLTFTVLTEGTISWKSIGSGMEKEISYRINGGSWTSITAGSDVTISVNAGDVVELKGNNQTYASDRDNYSGFDGGTATFNISGNIMSLIYGDNFVGETTMSGSYNFCSLFKQSKAVSAENLILPATSLTECCYRAMFSKCTTLEVAPALPATTLAPYCYYYMFEDCAITTAPELRAPTLVSNCYGNMFTGCRSLNYILCLAVDKSASNCLTNWVSRVSSTGTFVKKASVTWTTGNSGIPTNWTVVDEGTPDVPTISCDGFEIELSCTTTGAVIYYQLDHSGNYTQYTAPITMTGNTFIECYSEKDGKTSATISQTCEYDDRTIYEYSNQSLNSWTYGGNTITTPYSVNAIDGHSSSYAKGTFNFETDVNLRSPQPTYLWFQHADQSATIYVDNTLVEKHWGGYTAFFVDISEHVHKGTNHIKVALKNNEGNHLAPASADFNFNATLGNVKLFTSPYMPSMSYGYDGFHITSTVSSAEATINVKTTIPTGATVVCTISGDNCTYTETKSSTGEELVFTTTITNPHLWNGTIDPYLYNVKLEIYHDNELYHRYERPYGLRFYEYVINETVNGNQYTGFLLNGQPYLLRGCCMHDDIEGKANALTDTDYDNTFNTIHELGLNFLRLAHYPHPKETYDRCDQLGIVVQTEGPCVNKMQSTMPTDYYTHLEGQYTDMVNQHYNHPCIIFWGLSNETTTDDKDFAKVKIEGYKALIKNLDPERWVGYVLAQGPGADPSGYYNNPDMDWFGCNIYVGWYASQNSNNPSNELNKRIANTITAHGKPVAYSEYGCGGTQRCHSESASTTTNKGSGGARHDIEYMMWLHEGHIATIKQYPQLLFTSQWQLFDIAVSGRNEGYTVCPDGENTTIDDELRRLNDKGLVERDHITKKDPFYLYKAWWNQTDKFVHICGKDYEKLTNRVIKCYTNDGNSLSLYVNNTLIETVSVTNNIAEFTARDFSGGDVIKVSGETSNDTFTFTNNRTAVFTTDGDWNKVSNWSNNVVPTTGSHVEIAANATIPANYVAHVEDISINEGATLTIADGGQLKHSNEGVTATVQKNIVPYTIAQTNGDEKANGWYLLASPMQVALAPSATMLSNNYDLYRFNQSAPANEQGITLEWENYHQYSNFTLNNGQGYLYANSGDGESPTVMIDMEGQLQPSDENIVVPLVYDASAELAGFNLVGNPFACNAYLAEPRDFLVMNATNDDLVINASVNGVIAPLQGLFVQAVDANDNAVTFTRTQPVTQGKGGSLTLNVYKGSALRQAQGPQQVIDRARVRFGEGQALNKFNLKPNGTKLFIKQGLQDYAVVYAEMQGEVPVNFKVAENGSYTLSVNHENTEMNYLHLIDNMTGADVDLLQTPEYTFEAKTDDYASRFRLVFSTDDENGASTGSASFAFINNGNIIITDNVEGATLQVIDMMGRVIVSREGDVSGNISTNGMTAGVYVLRLISGENVKTQKIMIR